MVIARWMTRTGKTDEQGRSGVLWHTIPANPVRTFIGTASEEDEAMGQHWTVRIFSSSTERITRAEKSQRIAEIVPVLGLLLVGASSEFDRGAFNPDVRQETSGQTICVPGYTKTVQPPTYFTDGVRQMLLKRAGRDRAEAFEYKLDYIVPVALGGHPRNLENFELRRRYGARSTKLKNGIEAKLRCLVCSGEVTLADAQREVSTDWQAAYQRYAAVKCQRGLAGGELENQPR
jgi:hypothetical protein